MTKILVAAMAATVSVAALAQTPAAPRARVAPRTAPDGRGSAPGTSAAQAVQSAFAGGVFSARASAMATVAAALPATQGGLTNLARARTGAVPAELNESVNNALAAVEGLTGLVNSASGNSADGAALNTVLETLAMAISRGNKDAITGVTGILTSLAGANGSNVDAKVESVIKAVPGGSDLTGSAQDIARAFHAKVEASCAAN